jgi:hypothetical protein
MLISTNSKTFLKKPRNKKFDKVVNDSDDIFKLLDEVGVIYPYDNGSNIIMIELSYKNAETIFNTLSKFNLEPTVMFKTYNEKSTSKVKSSIKHFTICYVLNDTITEYSFYEMIVKYIQSILNMKKITIKDFYFTGIRNQKNKIFHRGQKYSIRDLVDNAEMYTLINGTTDKPYSLFNSNFLSTNDLYNSCMLYNTATKSKVSNYELMLLSNNIFKYEHGQVLAKYVDEKWANVMGYFQHHNVKPYKCKFCSKYNKCENGKKFKTLYNVINNDHEEFNKTITIEEGRQRLDEMVRRNYESDEEDVIYVYNVQAGLGKTHLLLREYLEKGIVAFPFHSLKNEKLSELNAMNIFPNVSLDINDIVTDYNDQKLLSKYYRTNNRYMINKLIKSYENGEEFLKQNKRKLNKNTITTHHKLNFAKVNKNVNHIFYDEDPSQTCLFSFNNYNMNNVYDDIKYLLSNEIINESDYKFITKHFKKIESTSTPILSENKNKLKLIRNKISKMLPKMNLKLKTNIVDILSAETYSNNQYSKVLQFPNVSNIHIFSATPDIETIKMIAKKSNKTIKVFEIYNVKRKGKVEQIMINTSRAGMKRNKDKIEDNLNNDNLTITFKDHSEAYNDENVPYGGNTFGYNKWLGKDINIAYTFQLVPDYYFHKYVALYNKKLTLDDVKMSIRNVEWKGNKFKYYAYKNLKLRNLIFNHIDSEMIQALERSRTISENCTSTIVSNFICSVIDYVNIKK